ncbi:MAG: glycosyltransferase [Thermoanaerobaculia bacterium]
MRPSPLAPELEPGPAPAPTFRVLQVWPRSEGPAGGAALGSEPTAAVRGLWRALDAAGVRQQIVTPGPPRSPRRRRWGLHGEIHRVVPPAGARLLFGLAAAPLMDELAARTDLVHVHLAGAPSTVAAALWAARRQGVAAIVDVPAGRVGERAGGRSAPRFSALEHRVLVRADAVLCPDDGTLQRLAGRGLPEELLVPLPRNAPPAHDGGRGAPATASVAPQIRWGPVAADLLGIYRRMRRRAASGDRRRPAGRPLAEATGEGR